MVEEEVTLQYGVTVVRPLLAVVNPAKQQARH